MAQMTLEDFQIALRPKVDGTKNLANALRDQTLDFFVMFSSDASIVGNLSQANYAAGNAFMDALAHSTAGNKNTPFIALNIGGVLDAGAIATSERIQKILVRQGYHLIKEKELLAMIEYSLSEQARASGCRQFIVGFDYRSMRDSDNSYSLKNPMFSHLLMSKDSQETKAQDGTAAQSIENAISAAKRIEQVGTIVAEAIARKISSLVAVAYEEVDLQRSVVEFGLDSLVLIELKNWIAQKFQATLQVSEISDAKHIIALAVTVAGRSALVAKSFGGEKEAKTNGVKESPKANGTKTPTPAAPTQQKQPLPALDDTLNKYLETVRPLFTDNEHAKLRAHVDDFREGAGRQLQTRLEKLANDPEIDNWQVDLYTRNTFLRDRMPLIPRWNFYLSHLTSSVPHSPAQRAAIISAAALQFKTDVEAGKLTGTEQYSWFFNATREPGRGEDKIVKHLSSDYIVAFRRGHAYKIPLRQGGQPASYVVLKATFQAILDGESKQESWVGVLTADGRDSWTDVSDGLLSLLDGFILTCFLGPWTSRRRLWRE